MVFPWVFVMMAQLGKQFRRKMLKTYTPIPKQLAPVMWLDSTNYNSFSSFASYVGSGLTGTGTSGTTSITASATVGQTLSIGEKFRIGATDIYTISNISGSTITTSETLSTNYSSAIIYGFNVSQILDSSGSSYSVSQGTAANQPTANKLINGRNVLYFNGTGDIFQSGSTPNLNPDTGGFTFFFVYKSLDTTTQHYFLTKGATSSTTRGWSMFRISIGSTDVLRLNNGTTNVQISFTNTLALTILCVTFDGSTANVYQNGTLVGTNSYTGSITSTSNFTLGGRAGGGSISGQMDFGEFIAWKRLLNTTEIDTIKNYLSKKWGVAVS